MKTRWSRLAFCAAAILASRAAGAEPRVLIVETRDAPSLPGLAGQVQLHAGRAVAVTTTRAPDEDALGFAARAPQLVDEHDATIVVWVASIRGTGATERTFLVYAAGKWPGRAMIELVRLDAQTCQTGDECCSKICAPDASGTLVCSPGCIADGGTCTANADCCGSYRDPQTLKCQTVVIF